MHRLGLTTKFVEHLDKLQRNNNVICKYNCSGNKYDWYCVPNLKLTRKVRVFHCYSPMPRLTHIYCYLLPKFLKLSRIYNLRIQTMMGQRCDNDPLSID